MCTTLARSLTPRSSRCWPRCGAAPKQPLALERARARGRALTCDGRAQGRLDAARKLLLQTLHSGAPQPAPVATVAVLRAHAAQPAALLQLFDALRGDPPLDATLLALRAHAALGNWRAAAGLLSNAEARAESGAYGHVEAAAAELAAALATEAASAADTGDSAALLALTSGAHEALSVARRSTRPLLSEAALGALAMVADAACDEHVALLVVDVALRWDTPLERAAQRALLFTLARRGQLTECAPAPKRMCLPTAAPHACRALLAAGGVALAVAVLAACCKARACS